MKPRPKCKICDNDVKWDYSKNRWRIYCCLDCFKRDKIIKPLKTSIKQRTPEDRERIQEKRRKTCLEKYGVEHTSHSLTIQEKRKKTCLETYGTENPFSSKLVQEKQKHTMKERYGVENSRYVKRVQEKFENTMLERYGVKYSGQSDVLSTKKKHTMIERYGVEYTLQSPILREKVDVCMISRYGVKTPLLSPTIKQKMTDSMIERYGVDNPAKCDIFSKKKQQTNKINHKGVFNTQQHMIDVLPLLNDPDWLYEQYVTFNKTGIQIGKELNIWDGTVNNYLRKHNIEIRYNHKFSYSCICWLEAIMKEENIHILHQLNGGEYSIPNTRYKVDGYCVETNTVYEFYGDRFHGNLNIFNPTDCCHPFDGTITARELYEQTINREQTIKSHGYTLVVIWESDFK